MAIPEKPKIPAPIQGRLRAGCLLGILMALAMASGGCGAVISSAATRVTGDLSHAILNHNDPETVRDGAPAYLLLVDGLIADAPEDQALLHAGAKLYTAYAEAFASERDRAKNLTERALDYALRAACLRLGGPCDFRSMDFDRFREILREASAADVEILYTLGAAWAGWIQARKDDWNAVAEIARVEALMERVASLDESHMHGGAHLYLGYLATLLPPALGGKPEVGRTHFQRAIELSGGRHLMAKVLLAGRYARLKFDRDLHDRLLREVTAADPRAPELTLSNTLAKERARALLESADEYF